MTNPSILRAAGPWEHRDVHARGRSFHIVIAGDEPNRPTVILLHDFPLHWWSWRNQIPALADAGYRVIAMDLRGMGASDLQPGSVELSEVAEDVAAVAEATGTKNYTVVGTGIGGSTAWMLGHMGPSGLQSIVTVCAPHPLTRRPRSASRAIAAGRVDRELGIPFLRSRRLREGSLVTSVLTTWSNPENATHMSGVAPKYAQNLQRVFSANAALETQKAARTPSAMSKKILGSTVKVPVWSIRGGADGRIPATAYAHDTTHAGREVTQVEIPDAGHFPNEETPEELNALLIEYLAQAQPAR